MFTRNHSMITTVIALVLAGMTSAAQETAPLADQPSDNWRKFDERVSADAAPVAGQLTLPAGTWLTVRIEQELSSDRSLKGDAFTASLVQPLIANGVVVAMRGQMVGGQVVEAEKAGRAKGTSRLGVALTELSLVDGQQVPLKTRFTEYKGGTSVGRDVGVVATTTGVGAAIGAAADGGFGAGMGAIAGAAVGMVGVLTTRGKPTVVYPEAILTFRLEEPLTISTENSARAFRAVLPDDYPQQPRLNQQRRVAEAPPRPYYRGGWDGGWYDPYYPRYFYGPGFYGPSFYFSSGPRFYGGYRGGRR